MPNPLKSFLVVAALFLLIANAAPNGFYAKFAKSLSEKPLLMSPDGLSKVRATYFERDDDDHVSLTLTGKVGSGTINIGPGVVAELLWAPDSSSVAITTSDGGGNGIYRTIVISGSLKGIVVTDLTPLVRKAFGHPVQCAWPEYPNVGAIKWVSGSARLIVAAEIVAHSNCDSMGTFRAYEVDWRYLNITRNFDQILAKRLFGSDLGIELRAAPDICIRTPQKCWVSTNHPETLHKP